MKQSVVLVVLLYAFSYCCFVVPHIQRQKIIQISIPKSGTYLLASLINKLTAKKHFFITDRNDYDDHAIFDPSLAHVKKQVLGITFNKFWTNHLFFNQEYADFFNRFGLRTIFLYRDPRDQAISLAFYMISSDLARKDWPLAQTLSFDELLLDVIVQGTTFNHFPPITGGVGVLYALYRPWLDDPNVLSVRFEDLIGSRGGGSDELQMTVIKKIVEHLGLRSTDRMLQHVTNKIFGNTGYGGAGTFREGKIGAWKKYFKKEHVEAFKLYAGQTLIDWGYEKDLNWGLDGNDN